jgi:thiol-disulfide isomerase/thioredoxin
MPRTVCLAALAAALSCSLLAAGPARALDTGQALPALVAPRLDGAAASIAPESLRGKVVYVDFWASWCVPCRQSMPALDALQKKLGPSGFVVVGISKDVREADARRFLERVPVSFPLVLDEGDRLARAFGVKAMPSGYLADRRGIVREVHRGFTPATLEALEAQALALLAEAP